MSCLSAPGLGDAFTDKPVEHVLGGRHATKTIILTAKNVNYINMFILQSLQYDGYVDFNPLIQVRF